MDLADELVNNLNQISAETSKNHRNGVYSPRDFESFEVAAPPLLASFQRGDLALRTRIIATLTVDAKSDLNIFGMVMAEKAVRWKSTELILDGLTAMAIEAGGGSDWRDSIRTLAMLYNSAVILEMDTAAAFAAAAEQTTASFEGVIRGFPFREDRDLSFWGLRERMTPNGFTYS